MVHIVTARPSEVVTAIERHAAGLSETNYRLEILRMRQFGTAGRKSADNIKVEFDK
jgi:hypothetical protein